jgi:hypothetical protein
MGIGLNHESIYDLTTNDVSENGFRIRPQNINLLSVGQSMQVVPTSGQRGSSIDWAQLRSLLQEDGMSSVSENSFKAYQEEGR